MKINRWKKELLLREFPFLDDGKGDWAEFIGKFPPDELKVKRVDEALLETTPWFQSYDWSGGSENNYDSFFAVIGEEVVRLKAAGTWATGSGERGEESADTIGGQLREAGLRPDFIVRVEFDDTDANDNGQAYKRLVVYKNRGRTQTDAARKALRRAYKELVAELEAADAS